MKATEPDPTDETDDEPRHSRLLLWLAGALALLLCAGLVVQIGYRPDGWSGMYADALHGGFRGPYGGYPRLTDPARLPSGYRAGGTSRADSTYLFGGLRIETRGARTTDVTATRTANGTRYWQYHKGGGSPVTKAAVDRARGDLFLAWRSKATVRLEAVDVRAARRRWHQTLAPTAPGTADPLIFPAADASGQIVTVVWGNDVVGFDRTNGHRRWSFPLPSGCTGSSSAALASPTLVVGFTCGNQQTMGVGIAPATGRRLWTDASLNWRQITPIGSGHVALTADRRPPVVSATTGERVRTLPYWNPASASDGKILITLGCRAAGEICAIDPATGRRRWALPAPEGFRLADNAAESPGATDQQPQSPGTADQQPERFGAAERAPERSGADRAPGGSGAADSAPGGVAVDRGHVYTLLFSTDHPGYVSVGIADAATGSWLASVPLAATLSERVRTGRIAAADDGILLITTSTGDDLTLVPVG